MAQDISKMETPCITCGQIKQLAKSNKNCYDCYNARRRELAKGADRQKPGAKKKYPNMESKKCTKCQIVKPLTEYCKKTYYKTGHNSQCKKCAASYQKSKRPPKVELPHPEGEKECTLCMKKMPYSHFNRNRASRDKYTSRCKQCESVLHKEKKTKDINYAAFYYPINLD